MQWKLTIRSKTGTLNSILKNKSCLPNSFLRNKIRETWMSFSLKDWSSTLACEVAPFRTNRRHSLWKFMSQCKSHRIKVKKWCYTNRRVYGRSVQGNANFNHVQRQHYYWISKIQMTIFCYCLHSRWRRLTLPYRARWWHAFQNRKRQQASFIVLHCRWQWQGMKLTRMK